MIAIDLESLLQYISLSPQGNGESYMVDRRKKLSSQISTIAVGALVGLGVAGGGLLAIKEVYESYADTLVNRAIEKMSPTSFQQNEFSREYLKWVMKFCFATESKRNLTIDQQVQYCSCYQDERVKAFTMKEQTAGVAANWDPKVVPELQKKLDAMDAVCLQKTLK